jgi:TPR repeat protein|tara:strand:+ start:73 stop:528 length:456 start_codon:yes stop_codon:yes gene_type:complete
MRLILLLTTFLFSQHAFSYEWIEDVFYSEFDEAFALAKKGYPWAQFNVGVMYANGEGVSQSDAKAIKWYRKGAEQGNTDAQMHLGVMYANGFGIVADAVRAYAWWSMAKMQGATSASKQISQLKTSMTLQQIADGEALAANCYQSDYRGCE